MAAQRAQPSMVPSADQHQQAGRHQQLVGDRVEHAPEGRLLRVGAGEIAVEVIGDAGGDEDGERDQRDQSSSGQNRSATTAGTAGAGRRSGCSAG